MLSPGLFSIILIQIGLINGQNVRYERTRYMTGRDRVHSNYPSNNIPVLHHLESSMQGPKAYSSRPLFSWDDPRSNRLPTPRYHSSVSPTATTIYRYPKKYYPPPKKTPSVAYRSSYVYNSNPYNLTKEIYPQKVHQEHYGSKGYIPRNYTPSKNKSAYAWYHNRGYRRKYCQIGSDGICRRIYYPKNYGYYYDYTTAKAPVRRYRHSGEERSNEIKDSALQNEVIIDDLCEKIGGKCEHVCKEENGVAVCDCFAGYMLNGTRCVDINECEFDNGGCDGECINTVGSRKCVCREGFRFSSTDDKCVDVNECLLRNGHGPCQDKCTNTWGGYLCSCENLPGTKLASDNVTCEEVDDCSIGCSHSCVAILGRAFCTCPDGFELGDDWKTCKDIDECNISGETSAQCEFRCINTIGSFYCEPENQTSEPIE